jgi:hypothetical protein
VYVLIWNSGPEGTGCVSPAVGIKPPAISDAAHAAVLVRLHFEPRTVGPAAAVLDMNLPERSRSFAIVLAYEQLHDSLSPVCCIVQPD